MAGSACSTPFVSAPSTPARDPSFDALATAGFYSLPASPAALGAGDDEYGFEMGFQFEFSSQFPSPALEEMSSADELFHNGQIRPMRLVSSFLPRPPPLAGESPAAPHRPEPAAPDERGRSARRRRSRSHSPFRLPHCLSPASSSGDPSAASRSSSSSSTASSASSSSSSHHRRWRLLKDLLHRSSSDGNGNHHHHHHHTHLPIPLHWRPPRERG
ncbi:hypothetical protein PR202_ga12200 [Eleusine coracana subsp. coracana]|uniref:Uncharacterized protein n=1 Tax=Eleusine coracana subsp. coracana TaxID=191504 RepID=A0AAV5CBN3_ELECO|nr:hypothetical protein PR202_ga12200 [Eleusine coracana subsp. coracana]